MRDGQRMRRREPEREAFAAGAGAGGWVSGADGSGGLVAAAARVGVRGKKSRLRIQDRGMVAPNRKPIRNYHDIEAFQRAMALLRPIKVLALKLPDYEKFDLASTTAPREQVYTDECG